MSSDSGARPTYTGATLNDENGQSVGKIRDVVFEGDSDRPTWLVVKTGLLKGERYVPARGLSVTGSGQVVVPYGKALIDSAPKAGKNHALGQQQRAALAAHFDLN
ncbi:MAG: PRC-barrel domain-containing protein [Acidimicrobiales bacterium]